MVSSISTGGAGGPGAGKKPLPSGPIAYIAPALALIALFFIIPVLMLLVRSVLEPTPGLENYATLFGSTTYLKVFSNTFLVASLVTIVSVVVGFPVAWVLAILPRRWAVFLLAVIVLSMWTNLLARTYAWMVLLQRTGIINKILMHLGIIDSPLALVNNITGVTIGMVYIMLPFIILPLMGVISSIDASILRAAALCGAGKWQSFTRVLLPLSLPGVAAGALMVFVMSLGYFVTPALLGGASSMMLAELIAQLVQSLVKWGLGGAAAFVLLVVTLGLYFLQMRYLKVDKRS
ncbi:ABC transporter, membrane spanning protein OS=Castellaniella defragrans (strain DSM / CCUG 39792/ 65Phen) OX=1437824 GN=BN940_05661 PE=3 SV=1 [Castellaniella denitrificans]